MTQPLVQKDEGLLLVLRFKKPGFFGKDLVSLSPGDEIVKNSSVYG